MAGEREFLESLFGIKDDGRWVGSVRELKRSEDAGEDELRLRRLLDKDLEGCGRPLKVGAFLVQARTIELTGAHPSSDPSTADDQESRRQHHGVPDRDPHPLLQDHDGTHNRHRSAHVESVDRVRPFSRRLPCFC